MIATCCRIVPGYYLGLPYLGLGRGTTSRVRSLKDIVLNIVLLKPLGRTVKQLIYLKYRNEEKF